MSLPADTSTDHPTVAERHAALRAIGLRAAGHYDIAPVQSLALVNISENATFRLDTIDGQSFALRVHRPGYHSLAAINSELAWLMALRRDGVAITPVPVPGRDGLLVQHVPGTSGEEPRRVVLSQWESGREPLISDDLFAHFATLGETAARMHIHARGWLRPDGFTRFTWDFDTALGEDKPHWGRWREGMGVDGAKRALFGRTVRAIGRRLEAYGKGHDRFGLVHGDLRLANLLIDGDAVKVIDFDDCGFSWFMYDAATPVSFYEHEPQVPALLEAWCAGYRRVMPLAAEDEAEIPTFVMLRRLLLVAWIGTHTETELAKSMGTAYTSQTVHLCEAYLSRFGSADSP